MSKAQMVKLVRRQIGRRVNEIKQQAVVELMQLPLRHRIRVALRIVRGAVPKGFGASAKIKQAKERGEQPGVS